VVLPPLEAVELRASTFLFESFQRVTTSHFARLAPLSGKFQEQTSAQRVEGKRSLEPKLPTDADIVDGFAALDSVVVAAAAAVADQIKVVQ